MSRRTTGRYATALGLVALFAGVTFLVGLDRYGLWEPWETDRAARIQALAAHDVDAADRIERTPDPMTHFDALSEDIATHFVGAEVDETGYRASSAALATLAIILSALLGMLLFDGRSAVYGAIVFAGMPIVLLLARLIVWSPLPLLSHMAIIGGIAVTCAGRLRPSLNAIVGVSLSASGLALGAESAGLLLGAVAPALGAALGLAVAGGGRRSGLEIASLLGFFAVIAGLIVWVILDEAYLIELSSSDPTFVDQIRVVMHGTFPWSGLVVLGVVALANPGDGEDSRHQAGAALLGGLALSFMAQTIWHRTAGGAPLYALWPLAMGAGLALASAERERAPRRLAALICGLIMVLGLRDYALEPQVALAALGRADAEIPDGVRTLPWFASSSVVLGLALCLAFARGGERRPAGLRSWFARAAGWIWTRESAGGARRFVVPAILALVFAHGVLAVTLPLAFDGFPYGCLERRISLAAGLLVPALLVLAFVVKLLWVGVGLASRYRGAMVIGIGACLAIVQSHVVLPALSKHMSSRDVVATAEELGGADRVVSYRAESRASKLVGGPEVREVTSLDALVEHLRSDPPGFALIKTEDLARVDVRFRKLADRHVPVADDSHGATLLLAGALRQGLDRSPLNRLVPLRRPEPGVRARATFDDRITLLGYDILGRSDAEVCPGDAFVLRMYFECTRRVTGSQKIFVHIDGYGQRINGDHEPAEGRYSTQQWQPGDFIVDDLRLRVPVHFHPGDYGINVGFFRGSRRMTAESELTVRNNRVLIGTLRVR